jgi:hypothetical protein
LSKARTITLLDGGEKVMTGVTTEFVAKCIGAIVTTFEEPTRNQRVRIAEVRYTGKDLTKALEDATGESVIVRDQSTDEILKGAVEAGKTGDLRGFYIGNIIKLK